MNLISNWRSAWKMFSVQIPALNIAFVSTWAALPPKFQDMLPISWTLGIAVAMIVLGIAGRLIQQPDIAP